MAVTYVTAVTLGTVAVNPPTLNLTLPTFASGNLAVGDIIVIHVMSKILTVPANEINTPSGYTEKGTKSQIDSATAADDMRTAMFYKRAVSGDDGATVTVSRAGTSSTNLAAIAYIFRGALASGDPFDAAGIAIGVGDTTADTDIDFPAFDPAADRHVVYFAWHADDVTTTPSDISNGGFTFTIRNEQESSVGSDNTAMLWSADHDGTALGAVVKSFTSTAGTSIGYVYALAPATSGVVEADGSAAGSSTGASVAAAVWNGVTAAAGVAASAVAGAALLVSVASAPGAATGSAASATVLGRVGAAAGVAVPVGSGVSVLSAQGLSVGVAVASAEGADGATGSQGVASATATASAIGAATASAAASAGGAASALASSATLVPTGGTSAGIAVASGVGTTVRAAVANGPGVGTGVGIAGRLTSATATSAGIATVSGEGQDANNVKEAEATAAGTSLAVAFSPTAPPPSATYVVMAGLMKRTIIRH